MNRTRNQRKINSIHSVKIPRLASALLDWFKANARDLPWRRTRDPYAIWVSEIMLQQTQVKTVLPYWQRWMRELPSVEALAQAGPERIHKLWEGLGYYTRVRNLHRAAQLVLEKHGGTFPRRFNDVLALPGIGRYTAGAICSIAFNQPTPILDGNVIRVLTRIFGIGENPREKETNARLWQLADELVQNSKLKNKSSKLSCSHLNQSLMELGALVCTPRRPNCRACPVKRHCVAFGDDRVGELPNLGKRAPATERRFLAFIVKRNGRFLVRQRSATVVNAHLWEFPNIELNGDSNLEAAARAALGFAPERFQRLGVIKHSITRYRITLEAVQVGAPASGPASESQQRFSPGRRPALQGRWLTVAEMKQLPFPSAHGKILACLAHEASDKKYPSDYRDAVPRTRSAGGPRPQQPRPH